MIFVSHYDSPLGGIALESDGEALTGLRFDGQRYHAYVFSGEREEKELPVFEQTKKWLDVYFSGSDPGFMPPLRLDGTPFRLAVWEILRAIPYGRTLTYGSIARLVAEKTGVGKMSAQAVGGAVGRNPVAIIIPCHRVVGADGSLTGYAAGVDKKRRLLELEGLKAELKE